jgi:hypothetical protein
MRAREAEVILRDASSAHPGASAHVGVSMHRHESTFVEVDHQTYGLRERVEGALEPDSWVRTSMIVWLVLIIGSDKNLLSDLWSVNLGMLPLVRTLQQTFRKKIANLRPCNKLFGKSRNLLWSHEFLCIQGDSYCRSSHRKLSFFNPRRY